MQAPLATRHQPSDLSTAINFDSQGAARMAFASALAAVLSDLAALLADLPAGRYSAASSPTFRAATIGGHVRHILDHIAPIVDIAPAGAIDYDRRIRGTPIETDVVAGSAELARIIAALSLAEHLPRHAVDVLIMPTPSSQPLPIASSIDRELAFALSHTIHHCASIRSIAVDFGHQTAPSFGLAPSTLAAHKGSSPCAR